MNRPDEPVSVEAASGDAANEERAVRLPSGDVTLEGTLGMPAPSDATGQMPMGGVVLFAHGSGSSRFSPRNRYVAQVLRSAGLATMLVDLLTREEEQVDLRTRHLRFDISLLAQRLSDVIDWLHSYPSTKGRLIGIFGASTGAGAALLTAAQRPDAVTAVVSRGGRPDLAGAALSAVRAPTLLIVGGKDETVIKLNKQARRHLHGVSRLEIVANATHLFEEPGTLEQVALLARDWFSQHLGAPKAIRLTENVSAGHAGAQATAEAGTSAAPQEHR